MSEHLFSQAWARAWKQAINASSAYAQAAQSWNNSVGLVIKGKEPAAIRLELETGTCLEADKTTPEELSADYVLSASRRVWKKILAEGRDPVWALMSGQISLAEGSLASLMPYATAAKELLSAAHAIDVDALETEAETPTAPAAAEPPRKPIQLPAPAVSQPATAPQPATRADGSPETGPLPARPNRGRSIGLRPLDRHSPPMRLWEKAKVRGIWNPAEIDFGQDRTDWPTLTDDERDLLMRETSLFLAGEEAVTLDLLPLIRTIASEGRMEEEIFLTAFLWEEAKHVDAFHRFFDDVAADRSNLERYHSDSYRRIFYDELPGALERLDRDSSPQAQADASVTYHMIVEGVLAETGYHAYYTMLDRRAVLPGMRTLVGHVQSDEARHLAYGVFLLSRLVAEHGEGVWKTIESRMEHLLPLALGIIEEGFEPYETVPFGLEPADFVDFAQDQFRRRFSRIEKARRQTVEEVYRTPFAE
jgi:ribonucleoside-diphosphate reductase beta chain